MPQLLEQHPAIFEAAEFSIEDDALAELEAALGIDLPKDYIELLRLSDGGRLVGPTRTIHLASSEELIGWAQQGVIHQLEALPIAQDEAGTILVIDTEAEWGGPDGAVYRLTMGRRFVHGHPVQDAFKVADSLTELLGHLAEGKDAW